MNTASLEVAPLDFTLDEVISFWARKKPDFPALECDSTNGVKVFTWAELEEYIQGLTEELRQTLARGDAAAVVCDDNIDFHILVNALWRSGVSVMLINRTWGTQVVEDMLNLTNCDIVYSSRDLDVERYPQYRVTKFPDRRQPSIACAVIKGNPDDVAIYATTSGTTDNPKCLAITHKMIRTAYFSCITVRDFCKVKRAASLFQLNGIGVMGVCFLLPREVGAATRVFPPFSITNVRTSWETLFSDKIDFVYLVPALVRLLNGIDITIGDSCEVMAFCAAAPVENDELLTFEKKYPIIIYNTYGLTEMTFAVFFGCREDNGQASNSIGYPKGIEARIVDADGSVVMGPTIGELHLSGPMLTHGYIDNPSATAQTWIKGWLKTGDIAERNADGRYFIRGRLKDAVIRGGILYYLHELEYYLRRGPNVIDACAFKGRDLPSGDELCVLIHVKNPIDRAEMLCWIRKNIGEEKVPNALIAWQKELPRNSNGKVLRNMLADMYLDGELRDE